MDPKPGARLPSTTPVTTPLTVTAAAIHGADDQFVTGPSWPAWTVVHLAGSDDQFTVAGQIRYPNGEIWHAVAMLILKGGKVWRETDYSQHRSRLLSGG